MKIVFKTCLVVILLGLTIIGIILLNLWLGILEIVNPIPANIPLEPLVDINLLKLLTIVLPIMVAFGIVLKFIPQKKRGEK